MTQFKHAGKAVIAMIKGAKTEFKKELIQQQLNKQEVKTTKVEHKAVQFYDDHTGKMETATIFKIVLENGKVGMAYADTISCINAFDFNNMELSQVSIGGNFDNRPQVGTLEEAVQKYNESVMINGIKIKSIYPVTTR